MTRWHWWTLAAFAALLLATWWSPLWPGEQALHTSLTVVALLALAWVQRHHPLPLGSWSLVLLFLSLHTIAARWLYSAVPYDDWTQALVGIRLSDAFDWHRNHFDRLVHLTYGFCLAGVLHRHLGWWRSLEVVISTSALYELLEWGIAMTLAPDLAESYNGQQGDMWDPHKDIALAILGAVVMVVAQAIAGRRRGAAFISASTASTGSDADWAAIRAKR
jgi:putative membrane protein